MKSSGFRLQTTKMDPSNADNKKVSELSETSKLELENLDLKYENDELKTTIKVNMESHIKTMEMFQQQLVKSEEECKELNELKMRVEADHQGQLKQKADIEDLYKHL